MVMSNWYRDVVNLMEDAVEESLAGEPTNTADAQLIGEEAVTSNPVFSDKENLFVHKAMDGYVRGDGASLKNDDSYLDLMDKVRMAHHHGEDHEHNLSPLDKAHMVSALKSHAVGISPTDKHVAKSVLNKLKSN